jgi:hypothetical protein
MPPHMVLGAPVGQGVCRVSSRIRSTGCTPPGTAPRGAVIGSVVATAVGVQLCQCNKKRGGCQGGRVRRDQLGSQCRLRSWVGAPTRAGVIAGCGAKVVCSLRLSCIAGPALNTVLRVARQGKAWC